MNRNEVLIIVNYRHKMMNTKEKRANRETLLPSKPITFSDIMRATPIYAIITPIIIIAQSIEIGPNQRELMNKMAVLGLLLGTIMTSTAFAGANTLATGSAKVKTSPAQVTEELIQKLKVESHRNAFDNCTRSNDYDMCEMTTAQTSCEQSIERGLTTLTDIISEDSETPVSVTVTCTTNLEF